jgi:hypothetical protein
LLINVAPASIPLDALDHILTGEYDSARRQMAAVRLPVTISERNMRMNHGLAILERHIAGKIQDFQRLIKGNEFVFTADLIVEADPGLLNCAYRFDTAKRHAVLRAQMSQFTQYISTVGESAHETFAELNLSDHRLQTSILYRQRVS